MIKTLSAIFLLLLTGCNKIPVDPAKTFEKAREKGLSVGYSINPPWTTDDSSSAGGPEGFIIKKFAASNNMTIDWQKGSEQELLRMLEEKEIDIVISGIKKDTPWKKKKIGLTNPYYKNGKDKRVIAVIQGENRLIKNLEKFFYDNNDSIKLIIDASKQNL
ncbi:MAG TPA: transporter substrate-binding domain-containing protein [Bacteroidales bacterium]|nr:transporter substrate-binding domain-containing protein [Bacteroidales bacterium]